MKKDTKFALRYWHAACLCALHALTVWAGLGFLRVPLSLLIGAIGGLFLVVGIVLAVASKKVEKKINTMQIPQVKGQYTPMQFLEQVSLILIAVYCWFLLSKTVAVVYAATGLISFVLRFQYQRIMKRYWAVHPDLTK